MQLAVAACLLLAALAFSGCSDPPATDPGASPGETSSSSSSSAPSPSATSTSPQPRPSSTSSSSSPASATSTATASASGTTSATTTSTGSQAAAPTPVTVECTLFGGGQLFAGPSWNYYCETPEAVSDTGAPFTKGHAKATFSAPPQPTDPARLTVMDHSGREIASATGESPIELDFVPPASASFTLVAEVSATLGPVIGPEETVTGTVTFTLS
jgi:hypothetical protein